MDAEEDHIKEVYARFGVALYRAQCLEHGLVNALLVLELIPTKRHLASSPEEWSAEVDAFMDVHFEATMGKLLHGVRQVCAVPNDLEASLRDALHKRNYLAHDFFRVHAMEFMHPRGRDAMLEDIESCTAALVRADQGLTEVLEPLLEAHGLTKEMLGVAYEEMLTEALRDG